MLDNDGNGLVYQGSLVYRKQGDILTLESAAVAGGRIVASQTTAGASYTPRYYVSDHLGSTRAVTDGSAANTVSYDYYPFGKQWSNPEMQITDNRDLFNGKEWQPIGGVNLLDYGARVYDPELGVWGVPDPMAAKKEAVSPYLFCSNNPINRIDFDGNWDVTIHLHPNRNVTGYGIAVVTDRTGTEIFRFQVRAEGTGGRDRMKEKSDTPLGIYNIPDNGAWTIGGSRQSYGPNYRLLMNGVSGEIKESGRFDIRIHGGRQENFVNKNWGKIKKATLSKTWGCLRALEEDMVLFKQLTDALGTEDSEEIPGIVSILDDLPEFKTQEDKQDKEKTEEKERDRDDEQSKMPSYREHYQNLVRNIINQFRR